MLERPLSHYWTSPLILIWITSAWIITQMNNSVTLAQCVQLLLTKWQSFPLMITTCLDLARWGYRPYALTSRLHNNDAMLGVKTCRAARTCCASRAHWRSTSQSVRGPGPARRYGMQGLARWLHAWRWRTWQCFVWPPTHGGALLWRHMHMVYCYDDPPLVTTWLPLWGVIRNWNVIGPNPAAGTKLYSTDLCWQP